MQAKLKQIINEIEKSWGPLELLPATHAVRKFTDVLERCLPTEEQTILARALNSLMARGLTNLQVKRDAHVPRDLILSILSDHLHKETTFYVYTGSWSHHTADDNGSAFGNEGDYCDHLFSRYQALFDKFEDAQQQGFDYLTEVLEGKPDVATNATVGVQMFDGEHLIGMGTWTWDKHSSVRAWNRAERH